jgi:hypothetical protein
MERPERIVLFMIGALTNRMAAVLWVVLTLSILTVANRIYYTDLALNRLPMPTRDRIAGVFKRAFVRPGTSPACFRTNAPFTNLRRHYDEPLLHNCGNWFHVVGVLSVSPSGLSGSNRRHLREFRAIAGRPHFLEVRG